MMGLPAGMVYLGVKKYGAVIYRLLVGRHLDDIPSLGKLLLGPIDIWKHSNMLNIFSLDEPHVTPITEAK